MKAVFLTSLLAGSALAECNSTLTMAENLEAGAVADVSDLREILSDATLLDLGREDITYTFFAPNNPAVSSAELAELSDDVANYHIYPEAAVQSSSITTSPQFLPTAAKLESTDRQLPLDFKVVQDELGDVMVNDATVVTADCVCSNGVIHVIDQVLSLPPNFQNWATTQSDLSDILSAIRGSEALDLLGGQVLTVFAPTNEAFENAGIDLSQDDSSTNFNILNKHTILGSLNYSPSLLDNTTVMVGILEKTQLVVSRAEDRISLSSPGKNFTANIIRSDYLLTEGVVHVVDAVMYEPPTPAPSNTESPTAAENSASAAHAAPAFVAAAALVAFMAV